VAWPAVTAGEPVVGEVGLPAFVGLFGGEANIGRLRPFARRRGDQPLGGQVPGDGGPRDGDVVSVLQVPGDGVGPGIQAPLGEAFTHRDDEFDGLRADRGGR
jgi:hypothetical protein